MDDVERVRSALVGTRFRELYHEARTDSTNRLAVELAGAGAGDGLVVVADHQWAGRGRLGRTWEAPAGTALLVSVFLHTGGLAPGRWHLLTAAASLATRSACSSTAQVVPDLKWPNDLLVGPAKLAGILAQTAADGVVVGIGCNVLAAPEGAVSLAGAAGRPVDRWELLIALLVDLEARLGHWDRVADDYRAACATVGRAVRVELASVTETGVAEAVDNDGHLVVRTTDGRRLVVAAGDVVHLRPG